MALGHVRQTSLMAATSASSAHTLCCTRHEVEVEERPKVRQGKEPKRKRETWMYVCLGQEGRKSLLCC
jgi:hypothetical protein